MTIDFDSGAGLFDRIGKIDDAMERLNVFLGGTVIDTLPYEVEEILAKYDGSSLQARQVVDGLPQAVQDFRDQSTLQPQLQTAAAETLIEMVDSDNPLPVLDTRAALEELIRQMEDQSKTVQESSPTLAVTPTAGNSGNGLLFGTLLDARGWLMENAIAEDFTLQITDAATRGAESGTLAGQSDQALGDPLHPNWPSGSGAQVFLTVENASDQSFLTNGDMEATPFFDGWDTTSGTVNESSTAHRGAKAAELVAGSHEHTQDLSAVGLEGLSGYPLSIALRATAALTGTLVLDLYDGAAAIPDELGNASELSIDLSTVPVGSYQLFGGFLRIPSPVPETITFRLRTSTAIAGGNLLVDDVLMHQPVLAAYEGGPSFALAAGSNDMGLGDRIVATISNAYTGKFQRAFHRLFNIPDLPLPSSSSPNIPDSLID